MHKLRYPLLVLLLLGSLFLVATESYRRGSDACYREANIEFEKTLRVHPLHKNFDFLTVLPNGVKFKGRYRNYMEKVLLAEGYYEPQTIEVLQRAVKYLKKKGPVTYLDVGANVGMTVLPLAKLADTIVAVEPYPPVVKRLQENIDLNQFQHIEVLKVGFGKEQAQLKFSAPPVSHDGIGTFSDDVHQSNEKMSALLKKSKEESNNLFTVVTGDSVFADREVHLIKIDIEGYERYALEGLRRTLSRWKPIVVFELNRNKDGGFLSQAEIEQAFPSNYSFYRITDNTEDNCLGSFRLREHSQEKPQILALGPEDKNFAQTLEEMPCDSLEEKV